MTVQTIAGMNVNLDINPSASVDVTIDPPQVVEVTLMEPGPQGPMGPSPLWIGSTPPDPNVYPLWLDTSY